MGRLILLGVLVYVGIKVTSLIVRYLGKDSEKSFRGEVTQDGIPVNEMVRDPVCGRYVLANQAFHLSRGGINLFFCSEDCRRKFMVDRG